MFRQQYLAYLAFLGGSVAISIFFQIILPFPFGLLAALAFFIVIPIVLQNKMQGKIGSIGFIPNSKPNYYCLSCGNISKRSNCPKCDSRRSKVVF